MVGRRDIGTHLPTQGPTPTSSKAPNYSEVSPKPNQSIYPAPAPAPAPEVPPNAKPFDILKQIDLKEGIPVEGDRGGLNARLNAKVKAHVECDRGGGGGGGVHPIAIAAQPYRIDLLQQMPIDPQQVCQFIGEHLEMLAPYVQPVVVFVVEKRRRMEGEGGGRRGGRGGRERGLEVYSNCSACLDQIKREPHVCVLKGNQPFCNRDVKALPTHTFAERVVNSQSVVQVGFETLFHSMGRVSYHFAVVTITGDCFDTHATSAEIKPQMVQHALRDFSLVWKTTNGNVKYELYERRV